MAMASSVVLVFFILNICCCYSTFSCPDVCKCFFSSTGTQVVCSNASLLAFPLGSLPDNTTTLSIEFTNLSSISARHLEDTPLLQELHLSGNQLRSLPENLLKGLVHLHTMDLTGNLLEHLPAGVFDHAPLVNLVLRDNLLLTANASWFSSPSNLTWLNLAGNRLSTMPSVLLQKLPQLKTLDLSQNHLEKLVADALDGLLHLQRLHLEGNKLSFLDPSMFHRSSNLTHLFLQDNRLDKLPPSLFKGLPHLKVLSLNGNNLSSLPSGLLDKLPSLGAGTGQGVDLSQNPWECKSDIAYLWQWLHDHQAVVFSPEDILCASPETLKGRPVLSLTKEEIKTE